MFKDAKAFDQPAVSGWLKGTHAIAGDKLKGMFEGASAFNQELNSWNVAQVTSLEAMFKGATNFSKEIGSWNVAKVISTKEMFSSDGYDVAEGSRSYFDQNLNDWDVGKVTDMSNMFHFAVTFNAPLSSWNVAKLSKAAVRLASCVGLGPGFGDGGGCSPIHGLGAWSVPHCADLRWRGAVYVRHRDPFQPKPHAVGYRHEHRHERRRRCHPELRSRQRRRRHNELGGASHAARVGSGRVLGFVWLARVPHSAQRVRHTKCMCHRLRRICSKILP